MNSIRKELDNQKNFAAAVPFLASERGQAYSQEFHAVGMVAG